MPLHEPSYFAYRTPYGPITIRADRDGITDVAFGDVPMEGERRPNRLSNRAATELQEYFAGRRRVFDLPLSPNGSPFQHAVWNEITRISYGETRTNTQIASAIGKSGAFRAVGVAVRANPLNILVPSHRIVGANGRPQGADKPAQLRRALLELERCNQSDRNANPRQGGALMCGNAGRQKARPASERLRSLAPVTPVTGATEARPSNAELDKKKTAERACQPNPTGRAPL